MMCRCERASPPGIHCRRFTGSGLIAFVWCSCVVSRANMLGFRFHSSSIFHLPLVLNILAPDSYGSPGDSDGVERTLPVDVRARKDNTERNGWMMYFVWKSRGGFDPCAHDTCNIPSPIPPWYLQGMPTVSQVAPRTCCPPPPMPATWNALALSSASKLYHR